MRLGVIGAVATIGGVLLWRSGSSTGKDDELGASFEYDLSALRDVPDELINGEELGQIEVGMSEIRGLAVDDEDRVYVAGDRAVRVFTMDGTQLAETAVQNAPRCLAVSDQRLYVGMRDHVEVYDARTGDHLASWPSLGTKAVLTSIVVIEDNAFVADAGNRLVYRYNREGAVQQEIGKKDQATGEPGYVVPSPYFDLAVGHDESLWVVDPGRHELVNYSLDGRRYSSWGKTSMGVDGFCGCCNPAHIAVRSDGSFVTSEKGLVRVKLYGPVGDLLGVIAAPNDFAIDTKGLDLAIDSAGRILVLDPEAGMIRIYRTMERE